MATSVPAPFCDPHVGSGQGRGVVHAVADHGHPQAPALEVGHGLVLVLRQLGYGGESRLGAVETAHVVPLLPERALGLLDDHARPRRGPTDPDEQVRELMGAVGRMLQR